MRARPDRGHGGEEERVTTLRRLSYDNVIGHCAKKGSTKERSIIFAHHVTRAAEGEVRTAGRVAHQTSRLSSFGLRTTM